MKKVSFVVLALCVVLLIGVLTQASTPTLASLEIDECIRVLEDLGVEIPDELESQDVDLDSMIHEMVSMLESDPDCLLPVDYSAVNELFEDIRTAVKQYHGL